jgi:alpha-tubulin suppressor-like RCC1 family protein
MFGLRANGTLWTWGSNNANGRLGDGTTVTKCSPVSVIGGFTDWCCLGIYSAVRANGTLWSWGGSIGDGTTVAKCSPVSVVGGFTDWCATGSNIALRTNGTLWTWGYNSYGQLGDGTTVTKSSPVSVLGGFTDWCQISTNGGTNKAAIRANGTLWTWGRNNWAQLGNNSTTNRSSPVSVVGGFTDWCQVSAGGTGAAAIRTNGTLWSWGLNTCGSLGDGTGTARSSPVSVVGGFTDWCQVSFGSRHVAAIKSQ